MQLLLYSGKRSKASMLKRTGRLCSFEEWSAHWCCLPWSNWNGKHVYVFAQQRYGIILQKM